VEKARAKGDDTEVDDFGGQITYWLSARDALDMPRAQARCLHPKQMAWQLKLSCDLPPLH